MTAIKSYYSSSPESTVERQMADLRNIKTAEQFVAYLDDIVRMQMSESYFAIELIGDLTTSAAASPVWYGYVASINVLGTPMLFSNTPQSKYWIAGTSGNKKSIDKHHIFPKEYLYNIGIQEDRHRNQIANFTYLDYNTNIDISDNPPIEYVSLYKEKLGKEGYEKACAENALPLGFESLDYFDFLQKRRKLMAEIVKKAYNQLWR